MYVPPTPGMKVGELVVFSALMNVPVFVFSHQRYASGRLPSVSFPEPSSLSVESPFVGPRLLEPVFDPVRYRPHQAHFVQKGGALNYDSYDQNHGQGWWSSSRLLCVRMI